MSAIYILSDKGTQLVGRDFRGDLPANATEKFIRRVKDEEEQTSLKPVFEIDGVSYVYLMHHSLYVVAMSNLNSDAALILMFLHELLKVFTGYFGKLEEESIRDNFVVIHELLDEMMDFGFPQVTNTKLLQEFIKTEHHQADMAKSRPPPELTKNTGRPAGIVYQKNEAFLDVVEKVNLLVNQNGTLLKSEIEGQIRIKAFLSGMPEVRLGLNNRVQFGKVTDDTRDDDRPKRRGDQRPIELEDVSFHSCVRLSEFETDKTISFIPPDGAFTLMSYRINTRVKPLIWVEAHIQEFAGSRLEITVKARAQFNPRSIANDVQILVPVPADVHTPKFKSGIGAVKYAPEVNSMVWKIKQFQGGKEYLMHAHFGLSTVTQKREDEARHQPPISVKFEVPYFTVSGIQVRYLKIVERSGYQALPWVRYITQSGSYEVRCN